MAGNPSGDQRGTQGRDGSDQVIRGICKGTGKPACRPVLCVTDQAHKPQIRHRERREGQGRPEDADALKITGNGGGAASGHADGGGAAIQGDISGREKVYRSTVGISWLKIQPPVGGVRKGRSVVGRLIIISFSSVFLRNIFFQNHVDILAE